MGTQTTVSGPLPKGSVDQLVPSPLREEEPFWGEHELARGTLARSSATTGTLLEPIAAAHSVAYAKTAAATLNIWRCCRRPPIVTCPPARCANGGSAFVGPPAPRCIVRCRPCQRLGRGVRPTIGGAPAVGREQPPPFAGGLCQCAKASPHHLPSQLGTRTSRTAPTATSESGGPWRTEALPQRGGSKTACAKKGAQHAQTTQHDTFTR